MAKFKHNEQTMVVLQDLDNRLTQLIEAAQTSNKEFVDTEVRALQSARTLVDQCIKTGHVFRGSDFVPDGLLPYVKTPSYFNPLKVIKGSD